MSTFNKNPAPLPPQQQEPDEPFPLSRQKTEATMAQAPPQYAPAPAVFTDTAGPSHDQPSCAQPAQRSGWSAAQPTPLYAAVQPQAAPCQPPKPQQQDDSTQTEQPVFKEPEEKKKAVVAPPPPRMWRRQVGDFCWNRKCCPNSAECCCALGHWCPFGWCSPWYAAKVCDHLSDATSELLRPMCCMCICLGDCCLTNPVIPGFGTRLAAVVLRMRVRRRYGITQGCFLDDIVCGCCCPICVIGQVDEQKD